MFMKKILSWTFLLFVFLPIFFIEAPEIFAGQDVGATARIEKTEKEQKAMIKKLSRKKKKVEVKGEEAIARQKPAAASQQVRL